MYPHFHALCVYPIMMALDNLPSILTYHRFLGPCIKHCGVAPSNPVVDNSLCILMIFWAGIEILHIPLTAHVPSWLHNRAPLAGDLASVIGHILEISHPNPQFS